MWPGTDTIYFPVQSRIFSKGLEHKKLLLYPPSEGSAVFSSMLSGQCKISKTCLNCFQLDNTDRWTFRFQLKRVLAGKLSLYVYEQALRPQKV